MYKKIIIKHNVDFTKWNMLHASHVGAQSLILDSDLLWDSNLKPIGD